MMSLQWRFVAGIVYTEVAVLIILLLPWIRPATWRMLFKSRIAHTVTTFSGLASNVAAVVLFILFVDAVREVRLYSHIDENMALAQTANSDTLVHMRLFHAERDLYLSGFALILFFVIRRITKLLQKAGEMEIAAESALKEADTASKEAKRMMDSTADEDTERLRRQNEELQKELKGTKANRDAILKQSEHLQNDYNQIADRLSKLEKGGKKKK